MSLGPEEDAHCVAQEQVQAKLDREAAYFGVVLVFLQAVHMAYLGVCTLWSSVNYVPLACAAASLCARCVVMLLINAKSMGRFDWVNQQLCLGLTFCLDGMGAAVVIPEIQLMLYKSMPFLDVLGEPPDCSEWDHGTCRNSEMRVLLTELAFGIIFILRFKHAVWATSIAFVTFQASHAISLGRRAVTSSEAAALDVLHPLVLLTILLVAKRRMEESLLRQLSVDLTGRPRGAVQERQREGVHRRVKRGEMDILPEHSGVQQRGGSAMRTLTVQGSSTSSGGAFNCDWRKEEEESPLSKLQQLASWGRLEHWLVNPLHLTVDPHKALGHGSFGTIVSGRLAGSPVAVKLLRKYGPDANFRELANELRIFRHLRHSNVAAFYGACVEPELGALALVLELVKGICLQDYVDTVLSNQEAMTLVKWSLMLDVNRALLYLHTLDPPIIHGDVKPANVMVEQMRVGVQAKLLDFGLSRVLSPQARKLGGTRTWMAPEVLNGTARAPRAAADVYSYGMTAYFIVSGTSPARKPLRWPPGPFSRRSQRLMAKCLRRAPEQRISMAEVHQDLLAWPRELSLPTAEPSGSPGLPWLEALRVLRDSAEGPRPPPPPAAAREREREGSAEDLQQPLPSSAAEEHVQEGMPHADAREEEMRGLPHRQARWAPTPSQTKVLMLVDVLTHLCVPPQASSCCAFHNAVDDLFTAFQTMQDLPCEVCLLNRELRYLQCPTCLAVNPAEEDGGFNCDFCSFANSGIPSIDALCSECTARLDSEIGMDAAHDVMPL